MSTSGDVSQYLPFRSPKAYSHIRYQDFSGYRNHLRRSLRYVKFGAQRVHTSTDMVLTRRRPGGEGGVRKPFESSLTCGRC